MLNSLIFTAGATFARLLGGAVLMVFIARTLGPQEFGRFVLYLSLPVASALLVEFGHSTYVMREMGRNHEPIARLLARTLKAKALLSLSFVLMTVLIWAFGVVNSGDEAGYVCFCLMAHAMTFGDFLNVCFRGIQRFEIETRNVLAASALHVMLVVPTTWYFQRWTEIAVAFLVSRALYLVLSIRSFRQLLPNAWTAALQPASLAETLRQIRSSFVYALDAGLVTVRSYADVFLISSLLGAGPLGLYQAGMNLVRAVENLGPIIANVFLPKLSGLLGTPKDFERHEKQLLLLMVACGASCFFVLSLLSEQLLELIFGTRFIPAFGLFPFFGLYLLTRFIAMALGVVPTARGFQAGRTVAGLASLTLLVACALLLIPKLGVTAVAVANVLASLVLIVWFAVRLRKWPLVTRNVLSVLLLTGTLAMLAYLIA